MFFDVFAFGVAGWQRRYARLRCQCRSRASSLLLMPGFGLCHPADTPGRWGGIGPAMPGCCRCVGFYISCVAEGHSGVSCIAGCVVHHIQSLTTCRSEFIRTCAVLVSGGRKGCASSFVHELHGPAESGFVRINPDLQQCQGTSCSCCKSELIRQPDKPVSACRGRKRPTGRETPYRCDTH